MKLSRDPRGLFVALSLSGAGVIHLAAIRSHLGSAAAVGSFLTLGLIQLTLGAAFLLTGARTQKRLAGAAVGAVAIGAWFVSRVWGLPSFSGHAGPEQIGPADVTAVALQLMVLVLVLLPTAHRAPRAPLVARLTFAVPVVVVSAIASASLLSVPGHAHAPAPADVGRAVSHTPGYWSSAVVRVEPTPAVARPTPVDHVDPPGATSHSH